MAPQMGPRSLSTFPSGGRTDPPLRSDHAHGGAPLPMILRAIRAHSAEESARLLCTMKRVCCCAHRPACHSRGKRQDAAAGVEA